ncbi:MAG: A24 family peptidase [Vulcanimicrobiaceae bacterium]
MPAAIWLVCAACLVAVYSDVRTRRIPNWLTGSLALGAVVVHAFAGLTAVGITFLIMAVVTIAGAAVYAQGAVGGGDIKLAIAASGMLGFPLCIPFLLYTAIGGGLLAIVFILLRGNLKQSYARVVLMTIGGSPAIAQDKSHSMPYAIAFTFGAAMVALSQSIAPILRILQ